MIKPAKVNTVFVQSSSAHTEEELSLRYSTSRWADLYLEKDYRQTTDKVFHQNCSHLKINKNCSLKVKVGLNSWCSKKMIICTIQECTMGCLLFNMLINDLGKLLSNKPELFTVVKSKADF